MPPETVAEWHLSDGYVQPSARVQKKSDREVTSLISVQCHFCIIIIYTGAASYLQLAYYMLHCTTYYF